ncbi:MAG: molybdopterin-dependent oxidoreductase [Actinocatenispora sp.]
MVRRTGRRLTEEGPARRVVRTWHRSVTRPLPTPPDRLRVGPLRADAFRAAPRSERLTSQLGIALGMAVVVCFGTGLLSHEIQHPDWWFSWPSRPVGLYRVTQGVHVASGLVAVPLLLVKLWSVYPRLFEWPPVRDLPHLLSRASVAVLVPTALFQLVTGVLNTARWYSPMPFFFTVAHHWTAWILFGALLVHLGVKAPVIRRALGAPGPAHPAGPRHDNRTADRPGTTDDPGAADLRTAEGQDGANRPSTDPTRRGLLTAVAATTGTLTLVTVGQTVRPLAGLDVLGPRRPDLGPQGLPVNKSAVEADVTAAALSPHYRLRIEGPRPATLARAELAALPQHRVALPIACVEGWSATAHWTGVRVRDLLDLVGAPPHSRVRVESLQPSGLYRTSVLPAGHAADPLTLLALRIGDADLDLDHGYPCRLIAPSLPGVMQTKWVARLMVLP